jgi:hypothetical protein
MEPLTLYIATTCWCYVLSFRLLSIRRRKNQRDKKQCQTLDDYKLFKKYSYHLAEHAAFITVTQPVKAVFGRLRNISTVLL